MRPGAGFQVAYGRDDTVLLYGHYHTWSVQCWLLTFFVCAFGLFKFPKRGNSSRTGFYCCAPLLMRFQLLAMPPQHTTRCHTTTTTTTTTTVAVEEGRHSCCCYYIHSHNQFRGRGSDSSHPPPLFFFISFVILALRFTLFAPSQ